MKKINKILSVFLAVCTALTMFAVSSSAVATDINAGSSMSTATNIPSFGVDYASSLSTAGEKDWFKFTTKSNEAYYTISLKNYNIPTDMHGYNGEINVVLYDKNMQQYDYSSCRINADCSFNIKLETKTTYYVLIKMGSDVTGRTGNYQITVDCKNDNIPNEMSNASFISLNQTILESLDGNGDYDWYKFTTTAKKGEYKISMKNYDIPTDMHGYDGELNVVLYDKNMQQYAYSSCRISKNCSISIDLEANTTYYILVKMGRDVTGRTGNYEISVTSDSVSSKTLKSISVTIPTKTEYTVGESFNSSGLVVKAIYTDGTSETLSSNSYTLSGFDSSSAGTKTITVSATVGGVTKTATFTVTVKNSSSGGGIANVINNITTVIVNVFVQIKNPIIQFFNTIIDFFAGLFN